MTSISEGNIYDNYCVTTLLIHVVIINLTNTLNVNDKDEMVTKRTGTERQ